MAEGDDEQVANTLTKYQELLKPIKGDFLTKNAIASDRVSSE